MNQELTGKFIAQLRKEKNLTQKELAGKLGISDKTVSKWEIARNKHSGLRIQGRTGSFVHVTAMETIRALLRIRICKSYLYFAY